MHHPGGESKAQSSYSTARWGLAERATNNSGWSASLRRSRSSGCSAETWIDYMPTTHLHLWYPSRCKRVVWSVLQKERTPAHPPLTAERPDMEGHQKSPNICNQRTSRLISNGWEEVGRRDAHPLDTRQTAGMGRHRSGYLRSVPHCRNSGECRRSSNKGSRQQITKICLPYSNTPLRANRRRNGGP